MLKHALNTTPWHDILNKEDVNDCYNTFIDKFTGILDTCVPIKTKTIPRKFVTRESWMTSGLLKSSRKCFQLYKVAVGKGKNSREYTKYITYRDLHKCLK